MGNLAPIVLGKVLDLNKNYSGFFNRVTKYVIPTEFVMNSAPSVSIPSLTNALLSNSSRGTNIAARDEDATGTIVTLDTYLQDVKVVNGLTKAMIESGELSVTAAQNLDAMLANLWNRAMATAEKLARTKLMGLGTVATDDDGDPDYSTLSVENIRGILDKLISDVSDAVDGEIVIEMSPFAHRLALEAKLLYDTEMSAAIAATGRIGMYGGAEVFKIKSSVTPAKFEIAAYAKNGVVYANARPEDLYIDVDMVQTRPGNAGIFMNFIGGAGAIVDSETPGTKSKAYAVKLSAAL